MTASEEYLEHHGIRGQKWGIRRRSGPDGLVSKHPLSKSNGAGKSAIAKASSKPALPGSAGKPSSKVASKTRAGEGSGALRGKDGKLLQTPRGKEAPTPRSAVTAKPLVPKQEHNGKAAETKADDIPKLPQVKQKKNESQDAAQIREIQSKARKKGLSSLTNDELKALNNRINLQTTYAKAMEGKKKTPGVIRKFVSKHVGAQVNKGTAEVLTPLTIAGANKFLNSEKGLKLLNKVGGSEAVAARLAENAARVAARAAAAGA